MSISAFEAFLKSIKPHSLFDSNITSHDFIALDLSIHNTELEAINVSSSDDLEQFIWSYMKSNNAKIAYGGYLEKRGIYQRSNYFNQTNSDTERNIHLGLDLWIEAGTPIFAPLPGTIHSFKNNTNYGDYGPTIVLKHHIEEFEFYTLYGHLSLESIEDLEVGVEVNQGEQIATLGTAEINGDYPPHLHFQIIKDIQDFRGDYPGVSNQLDLAFYKDNCPDPNLLLKLY
ncbi:peptidoglycan DD-metalloendopeptidase family protein [Winogradskyella psychrotolerans]|uniref:peptidoglycan DD-metalloendopeptidase family protein n=1 Tax=Winogradskyella psychrotolerans TaxID=1344585 RepID=UPI001C074CDD|nr:peptidoglycan DD-metalloendopeptidase family protein [Winogradskyella psychrotolerans]MBU2919789.1 peptidoglycan DD-metalloendopeptidase family protein [Winogradskyella psychrotolerans]